VAELVAEEVLAVGERGLERVLEPAEVRGRGLLRGLALEEAGRVASLAATYAIEQVGTVEHSYTRAEFSQRYEEAFGGTVPVKFFVSG